MSATVENMHEKISAGTSRSPWATPFGIATLAAAALTVGATVHCCMNPDLSERVISFNNGASVTVKNADLRAAERYSMGTGGRPAPLAAKFREGAQGQPSACAPVGQAKVCLTATDPSGKNPDIVLVSRQP